MARKETTTLKAIRIIIERDPMTKIPKTVMPWEVPIFRNQYGDEKIEILGETTVEVDEVPEAQDEYSRLRLQFGIDTDTKQSHTDIVYGRGADGVEKLAKAIKAAGKTGDVEAAQKVADDGRKPDKETAAVRANAHRDPLADEFADQQQSDIVGAASGGPGAVDAKGNPVK